MSIECSGFGLKSLYSLQLHVYYVKNKILNSKIDLFGWTRFLQNYALYNLIFSDLVILMNNLMIMNIDKCLKHANCSQNRLFENLMVLENSLEDKLRKFLVGFFFYISKAYLWIYSHILLFFIILYN